MAVQEGSPTYRLADFVLSLRYENLSPEAVDRTKLLFLDFLGAGCGGKALADPSGPVLSAVRDLCEGQAGPATVFGEAETFPPHYAALLNGCFAHSMDFDDNHRESLTHPGVPVFSTLLALGEASHTAGRDFLAAAVAGYEVTCRLGKAHGHGVHSRGFHPTATTGIFGATAAGARLLHFSMDELLSAWGINLSQAAGTLQYLENGAWNKSIHTGLAAHNAIIALAMARRGVIGAADPFEGRFGYYRSYSVDTCDLASALRGLGEVYEVLRTAVKPYPCCRGIHTAIDGVLELAQRYHLAPEDVTEAEIGLNQGNMASVAEPVDAKRTPGTVVDGQFNVYFAVAIALLEGGFTWQSFRRLRDPVVRQLMARIRATAAEVPLLGARLIITTRDGERLVKEVPLARGEPELFLTREEILAKMRAASSGVLAPKETDALVEMVSHIEQLPDVAALAESLRSR